MNDRPARRPRVEIDSPMLVMEYLKNGNLADIIQRVRERKDVYVPDRILWKFFLCCKLYSNSNLFNLHRKLSSY